MIPVAPSPTQAIRWRAVLVGLALSIAICALTPYNNSYLHGTPLGGGHFPLAPFFITVWLTVFAALIRRFSGLSLLTGRELLVIWIFTVMASGIAYTGLARTFFINLTAPFHFATVGNRWAEALQPLLPGALYPGDGEAVRQLYDGLPGGREMGWGEVFSSMPWAAWVAPLLMWGLFILLCYFVMVCFVNLLARQWVNNERMNLPLLRVPLLMEEAFDEGRLGGFLLDRYLLTGLLVPVFIHTINGLHFYFPVWPQIPTLILAGEYFPQYGLFSGFYKLKIYLYPAFIGFAFLASRQISFSFWFFFILGGLLYGLLGVIGYSVPAAALGVTFGPTLAQPEETQMVGAYGVFFLFILWLARRHLMEAIKDAVTFRSRKRGERTEWFSVRASFWGAVLGWIAILVWLAWAGMNPFAAFLLTGAFFMVMIVASRVICQGGIAYFTLTAAPLDGLIAFFGPGFFSQVGLLLAAVVQKVLFLDLRESLMPSLFHAGSLSQPVKNKKVFLGGMGLVLVTSVAVSFGAMLMLCYKFGIRELQMDWASRTVTTVYANIQTLVETPHVASHWMFTFAIVGAVVMTGLVLCYHRFYWWPIHPIGYLTTYSSAMRILWFSFFVGWFCNTLCMRYGGVGLFKRLRLFFVGLIIGDFLMGGAWAVIGWFSDASYLVLPD